MPLHEIAKSRFDWRVVLHQIENQGHNGFSSVDVANAIQEDLGAPPGVPQPTEGQHIENQIDAAMIFARTHFVNVHCLVSE